ncbi:hypothetical protein BJY04DRAFT_182878 [Aspergillus karnatakaensis]|uniref:uncharacterized protein n=1 Tax=Aspergillus karnatakaensis TaxID=1810916 RepID=UPI003CCDB550
MERSCLGLTVEPDASRSTYFVFLLERFCSAWMRPSTKTERRTTDLGTAMNQDGRFIACLYYSCPRAISWYDPVCILDHSPTFATLGSKKTYAGNSDRSGGLETSENLAIHPILSDNLSVSIDYSRITRHLRAAFQVGFLIKGLSKLMHLSRIPQAFVPLSTQPGALCSVQRAACMRSLSRKAILHSNIAAASSI